MAEREKQRILKHLENEKRFTKDIIDKSETMIEQLKCELSSERKKKTEEEKTRDALRDIYKKISPRQGKYSSKINTKENDNDDDDEESRLDGETTVYHKDDPFLASTPRDRSLLMGRNESSDSNALRRQLEEQLNDNDDDDDYSLLNDQKSKSNLTISSRLPPTPKRQANTKFHSSVSPSRYDKAHRKIIKLDPTSKEGGNLNIKFLDYIVTLIEKRNYMNILILMFLSGLGHA
jgi:hypothetical protein